MDRDDPSKLLFDKPIPVNQINNLILSLNNRFAGAFHLKSAIPTTKKQFYFFFENIDN